MRRIRFVEERETLLDHVVSGGLSALAMFLTITIGPFIMVLKTHGAMFKAAKASPLLYRHVFLWGAILVAIAFGIGLVVGPRRMAALYGHFWGTEEPVNRVLTAALWVGVLAIVGIGYWLA